MSWTSRNLRAGILLPASIIACSGTAPLAAERLALADPGAFYEVYLDELPPASMRGAIVGVSIAGLRIDSQSKPFAVDQLSVMLGKKIEKGSGLCVRLLSRDGKYFARGRYRLNGVSGPVSSIEFPSKYLQKISDYKTADMAVSAYRSKSCDDVKNTEYFIVTYEPSEAQQKVIVQLRAGDARVRAQLGSEKNEAIGPPVLCNKLTDGPTIGFTTECVLPLPSAMKSGHYKLSIGETGSAGEIVVKTYSVILFQPE